jgi:hypothetical protein
MGSQAVRWSVAAGCVLAASGVWATPPAQPFDDVRHAYGLGQVTEARALARKYLASSQAAVRNAKSDWDRLNAVSLVQRAAAVLSWGELELPRAGRFRNCADLIEIARLALAAAERAQVPPDRQVSVRNGSGQAYSVWLRAAEGIRPRAELLEILHAHADEVRAAGWKDLEHFFPSVYQVPKPADVERVAAVAGKFIRGYATRDPEAMAATTWLSGADATSRFADNDMTFFAGTADRVSKIDFQPIGAEWVVGGQDEFRVYLPDVRFELVAPDGTTYSKTVERTLRMHVNYDNPSRLDVEIDSSRAERARIIH